MKTESTSALFGLLFLSAAAVDYMHMPQPNQKCCTPPDISSTPSATVPCEETCVASCSFGGAMAQQEVVDDAFCGEGSPVDYCGNRKELGPGAARRDVMVCTDSGGAGCSEEDETNCDWFYLGEGSFVPDCVTGVDSVCGG